MVIQKVIWLIEIFFTDNYLTSDNCIDRTKILSGLEMQPS